MSHVVDHGLAVALVAGPLCALAVCAHRLVARAARNRREPELDHDLRTMLRRPQLSDVMVVEDEPMERERLG